MEKAVKKGKEYLYLPQWYLTSVVAGRHRPLQTVLFLTDHCNLRCRHCTAEGHAGRIMKPWRQIEGELAYAYGLGSRFVDLEGGEPTLWRDGSLGINDVIRLAKEMGFFSVTVTSNGQRPFAHIEADSMWISVDGYRKVHDQVRGEGSFERLNQNIKNSGHPALSIAMAVNRLNWRSVRDVVLYAKNHPGIRQVSVNFHTPYPGTEALTLSAGQRNRVIDLLIAMKREGYPIMNSVSGLRLMRQETGAELAQCSKNAGAGVAEAHYNKKSRGRPIDLSANCWITNFILTDGTRLSQCPGKSLGVCDWCGFSMAGEMYSLVHMKPDTLLAGLKLRM